MCNERFEAISASNTLDFYRNEKNVGNQKGVKETIEYFETGLGKRAFNPLEFLNLLWKQRQFVKSKCNDTDFVLDTLKNLALNPLEKHILLGFILKWNGGYPVNIFDNDDCQRTFKAIEKEFLSYDEDTPEKEFCRYDFQERKKHRGIATIVEDWISGGITESEAKQLHRGLFTRKFESFNDLFNAAHSEGRLSFLTPTESIGMQRTKTKMKFDEWLAKNKGWNLYDRDVYVQYLTIETFIEFIDETFPKIIPSEENSTPIVESKVSMELAGKIHAAFNGDLFDEIAEKDLLDILNQPSNNKGRLKVRDKQKLRMYYLIGKLAENLNDEDWERDMCNTLRWNYNTYKKRKKATEKYEAKKDDKEDEIKEFLSKINAIFPKPH